MIGLAILIGFFGSVSIAFFAFPFQITFLWICRDSTGLRDMATPVVSSAAAQER